MLWLYSSLVMRKFNSANIDYQLVRGHRVNVFSSVHNFPLPMLFKNTPKHLNLKPLYVLHSTITCTLMIFALCAVDDIISWLCWLLMNIQKVADFFPLDIHMKFNTTQPCCYKISSCTVLSMCASAHIWYPDRSRKNNNAVSEGPEH